MNSDQLTSNVEMNGTGPNAGGARLAPSNGSARCYVKTAPLLEVMEDQLRYLMEHSGAECVSECPECARREQAKRCLLRVFE
jgi:hypothetical protein